MYVSNFRFTVLRSLGTGSPGTKRKRPQNTLELHAVAFGLTGAESDFDCAAAEYGSRSDGIGECVTEHKSACHHRSKQVSGTGIRGG